jgi:hypothetical protein
MRKWPGSMHRPGGTSARTAILLWLKPGDGVAPPDDDLDGAGSCEVGPGLGSPRHGTHRNHATHPARPEAARNHRAPRTDTSEAPSGLPPNNRNDQMPQTLRGRQPFIWRPMSWPPLDPLSGRPSVMGFRTRAAASLLQYLSRQAGRRGSRRLLAPIAAGCGASRWPSPETSLTAGQS